MKQSVRDILRVQWAVLLPWAEGNLYKGWDDEFKRNNADRAMERVASVRIDFTDLTDAEAELLGFMMWSEESGLRLIPLWLYRFIKPGQVLSCIDGTTVTVPDDYMNPESNGYIDNDHRAGALAYGFVPLAA